MWPIRSRKSQGWARNSSSTSRGQRSPLNSDSKIQFTKPDLVWHSFFCFYFFS
jgi:hypothetical protein